jgi:hypothetical protein
MFGLGATTGSETYPTPSLAVLGEIGLFLIVHKMVYINNVAKIEKIFE